MKFILSALFKRNLHKIAGKRHWFCGQECAHLNELRRISSGDFHIKNAKTVDEWIDIIKTS